MPVQLQKIRELSQKIPVTKLWVQSGMQPATVLMSPKLPNLPLVQQQGQLSRQPMKNRPGKPGLKALQPEELM
jgi:hypothetical protein